MTPSFVIVSAVIALILPLSDAGGHDTAMALQKALTKYEVPSAIHPIGWVVRAKYFTHDPQAKLDTYLKALSECKISVVCLFETQAEALWNEAIKPAILKRDEEYLDYLANELADANESKKETHIVEAALKNVYTEGELSAKMDEVESKADKIIQERKTERNYEAQPEKEEPKRGV